MAHQIAALAAMRDADIDTTDIPEILDWSGAVRGRFYRPVKQVVTIRLDADVVAWFKSHDRNYQTAVNRVLREYVIGRSREGNRSTSPGAKGRKLARSR